MTIAQLKINIGKVKNGVFPMVEINTCHLTREDAVALESRPARMTESKLFIGPYPYGYMFKTSTDSEELETVTTVGLSVQLVSLLNALAGAGIHYVAFDENGPKVNSFKQFDW